MTFDNTGIIERSLAALASGDTGELERTLHDDFVHNRPDATVRTKAEWLAAVRSVPLADLRVEVLHVLAAGDHVVLHSRRRLAGGDAGIVVIDIWRLDDGRIVEGWEVIEPVAEAARHFDWWRPAS